MRQTLERKKIILFGDSLTQYAVKTSGWATALIDYVTPYFDVINRGFSGYNTRAGVKIVPLVFKENPSIPDPDIITIFWGVNDSNVGQNQHVPLREFSENLIKIITNIKTIYKSKNDLKIILITPPPFCSAKWSSGGRDNKITQSYADAVVDVARQFKIDYIDLYAEMMMNNQWSDYLNDGLHLSDQGNQFLFEKLKIILENYYGDIQKLPLQHPSWKDLGDFTQLDSIFQNFT